MAREYRAPDWDRYRMDYRRPHSALEPLEQEIAIVDAALAALQEAGLIPQGSYDQARFMAHRQAVAESFEIPWTAITPRMERLLYAINALARPRVMIAAGIFCGFTFACNAGAAIGPGACYPAADLIGLEINEEAAAQAARNIQQLDPTGVARIVVAEAVEFVAAYPHEINLLYLDANGDRGRGKGIYLEILEAAYERLAPGALVLAHNSWNCAAQLQDYLAFVRNPQQMSASMQILVDGEGLEVSRR